MLFFTIKSILQNYRFILNPNNRKDPIMDGNKKLTVQIMVLKHININVFVYHGASNKTMSCPRMTKSVSAIAGMMLKHSNNTAIAIHKSIVGIGIASIFTAQVNCKIKIQYLNNDKATNCTFSSFLICKEVSFLNQIVLY